MQLQISNCFVKPLVSCSPEDYNLPLTETKWPVTQAEKVVQKPTNIFFQRVLLKQRSNVKFKYRSYN